MKKTLMIFLLTIGIVYATQANAEEVSTLYIGSQLVECEGVGKQECMIVRTTPDSEWTLFYDSIEGFDFEAGYEYEVTVLITEVENPPDDTSSKKYTLLEVVEKNPSSKRHIPYKDTCAPGFVALGKICVLNDRCGPGAYAGKVCVMDGKPQPYLRPLQQGNAGIAATNVICAQGLELIFKSSDAAPACVKPESVTKLTERGWQVKFPALACTLEYAPVCGVDGKTYGNKCMLKSQHVAMKNTGECTKNIEPTQGIFEKTLEYTKNPPTIDEDKGYFVTEIANDVYWLVGSAYQTMFITTDQGVVAVDAPQPIGEGYIDAIKEVTSLPVTHMIYSHHHQDHTGAAGQIFPSDITYISHIETADVLSAENDPNRPIPNVIVKDRQDTMTIGGVTIELHHLGNFHSNGDLLIILPAQNVAMLVDLLHPGGAPYRAFGVTPDIDVYLQTHDALQAFDFDVLISGHTKILATKEHIKTNKQFTLDVMQNAKEALDSEEPIPVEICAQKTIQQWEGKLSDLDRFMAEHCQAMIDYHNSQS